MPKATFYRGLPIVFACQFKTADTPPVPINTSGYSNIAIYILSGLDNAGTTAIPMTVSTINAAQGSFSAVLESTANLKLGTYQMQADYFDNAGVHQSSSIGTFAVVSSIRYG